MIPVKTNHITVQGNLNGDKIAMGVHAASLQKLIGILTDLYSDPTAAVIREYSTNAIDSHIAAGQTRPIEVTLPSPLSPYFRVKDFGLGLSVDDVREVYSQYGASTKDTSNDFNGMLGLGSKSALTFTSQFNVVAIKGGVKATVVVSRAADGTGTMEVVDTVSTVEPNGVEVIIPVQYGASFDEKARKFYSFWKPGTVLLNGQEPSLIKGNEVAPGIYSVHSLRGDYIVQGNVAYPVDGGLYSNGYYKDFGVVAYVENGSVAFAPSREALMYDETTNAEVARIREDFKNGLAESIQADLDDSSDHAEALVRFFKWKQMLGSALPQSLSYKKAVIPQRWDGKFLIYKPGAYRWQTTNHRNIGYNDLKNACIITDFQSEGTSQTQKNKIKTWADDEEIDATHFILVDKKFGGPWTDSVEHATWEDIKDVKVNKASAARTGPRGPVAYKVWDTATNWWKSDDNPTTNGNVFYLSPQEKFDTDSFGPLTSLVGDATIVMLGRNRWDKFLRKYPHAIHISKVFNEVYESYTSKLTDDDKICLGLDYYGSDALKAMDESKVDDPEVVRYIKIAKSGKKSAGLDHYNTSMQVARLNKRYLVIVEGKADNPLKNYPLVPTGYNAPSKHIDHVYVYMNAVYAASTKEN